MLEGQLPALIGFSLLLASGQILFRRAAGAAPELAGLSGLLGLLRLPSFWLALLLYGTATLLWLHVLRVLPLSRAYPFAALGFVLVPVAGVVFFRETISKVYVLGMLLILGGIMVISAS